MTSSRVSPSHKPIDVSRSRLSTVASIPVRTETAEAVSRARCRSDDTITVGRSATIDGAASSA